MFASGLAAGTHESYFPLVEQFMTQSSPPYCGLTTLAMMLNSLNIDPNQRWQGGWRWFNEDMLLGNCCKPRSEVEQDGMTMDEFAGIARCHGAVVECTRASEGGVGGRDQGGCQSGTERQHSFGSGHGLGDS